MEVKPFKAFRFDETKVGAVGDCVAPPYDVISGLQQQQLYEKSQYNIVRIIKAKTTASNSDSDNQYTRAADCLNRWLKEGVLKQDATESIYGYIQDFDVAGIAYQRLSFVALAKLEEFGSIVRPHENTLTEQKIDRLNLTRATAANLGLVFMLYEDQAAVADKIIESTATKKPLIDFLDEQGIRHRLFAVTGKDEIGAIEKMMADKSCIIADGHHRYETGLIYARQNSSPAAQYQMAAFVNTRNDGLVVLATHRLVGNLENFSFERLISQLEDKFEIHKFSFDSPDSKMNAKQKMLTQMKTGFEQANNIYGIYGGNNAFYTAVLKDKRQMDSAAPDMSNAWRTLDVSVLHKLILEELLGINQDKLAEGGNIEYVKDTADVIDESIAKVDAGQTQLAFFMNPPTIRQIKMVAEGGEKMPQKSTYFYPKLYSGLTINKL